jgi:predicted MFS family arabinose efflux permease
MDEWRQGWRIVLGAAIGGGTGASLLFFTFSLFIVPMSAEIGGTRGDMAVMQAVVGLGALASPLVGWAADRWGFRAVFTACSLITILTHLWIATLVSSLILFAVGAALFGLFGIGTGPLTYTRPVNAWFDRHRGLALGLAASGLAVSTIIMPPILAGIIETQGWRSGYLTLAALGLLLGLPAVLLLVKNEPPGYRERQAAQPADEGTAERHFLRTPVFWLLAASFVCMAIPGAGFVSQLSPILQEEGLSATTAALGLSAYAVGQISGRLIGGVALDRLRPQLVGFLFTALPATGFFFLWAGQGSLTLALAAAILIGVQQGAEIDLFAYLIARRFGLARYSTIYGWLLGVGWIGNAAGVLLYGATHDRTGSYTGILLVSAWLLLLGAVLVSLVRLPPQPIHARG